MRVIRIVIAWCFAATSLLSFWNVVRFLPTKVYTDGSGSEPSLVAKAVLVSVFVAVGSLFAAAWWVVIKDSDSGRKWAVLASFVIAFAGFLLLYARPITLFEKGWIPLAIGITGLFVFGRGRTSDRRSPSHVISSVAVPPDGTNAIMNKLVVIAAAAAVFWGGSLWSRWAESHDLSQNLPTYFYARFILTVLLVMMLHESGHLISGLALRMKVLRVAIGPLEWSNSFGKGKIAMQFGFRSWLRGQTLVAPRDVERFRERKIMQVAAGPFVSLATGIMASTVVIMSIGSPWENSWLMLSDFATISVAVGIFNLIPFRIGAGYSDGAKLFQLLSSDLWCRYHLLLGMIYASTVTPIRARDFDVRTIQTVAGSIAKGQDELFMRLSEYAYFLDRGELSSAASALVTAEKFCHESSTAVPADWITVFVFGAAFVRRDPVAARTWWRKFELKKSAKIADESWTSYSALLWIEGRRDEAEEAWQKADRWARELTDSGYAEGERNAVYLLRCAMDESLNTVVAVAT